MNKVARLLRLCESGKHRFLMSLSDDEILELQRQAGVDLPSLNAVSRHRGIIVTKGGKKVYRKRA